MSDHGWRNIPSDVNGVKSGLKKSHLTLRLVDGKSERMCDGASRNGRIPTASLEMHEQTPSPVFIEAYCFVNAFLVDNKQNGKKTPFHVLISVANSRAALSLWRIHMCL